MRHVVGRGALACCLLLTLGTPSTNAQSTQKNNRASAASTSGLSDPVDWGLGDYRIFRDDAQQVRFWLVTSWIPGENDKGMMRYKLGAVPFPLANSSQNDNSADSESKEKFLNRILRCSIFLDLLDHGGFVLVKHKIHFDQGVDNEARLHSLNANDALQMDAGEYRQWISQKAPGSWTISWSCYQQP